MSPRKPPLCRLGIEPLEDRLAPDASLPPDLVLGRTQSIYSTTSIGADHRITVMDTADNQRADSVTGVQLATALRPGVSFTSSTLPVSSSGATVAWTFGTIPALGRASVAVTFTLADSLLLQLDEGAKSSAHSTAARLQQIRRLSG